MEFDGAERDPALEENAEYDWSAPASLNSFVAPVLEATEVTSRTLQAMHVLFASFNMLHVQPGDRSWKPTVKTEEGFAACKAFLQALARASDLLGIRPQSRAYRNQFTKNYKALFPDHRRHYRVDVLEASQEGYSIIYVNGERYDFHLTVIERGTSFKDAWAKTLDVLEAMQHVNLSASPFWRSELVPVLVELDSKWAAFEEEYILELIQIERKARRYVMDVIFLENQLLYLDGAVASLVSQGNANQTAHLRVWQQWQSCRRQYVKKVFRLNAVANYKRKGLSSLDLGVLEASENIIKTSESEPGHVYSSVEHMAAECVTSFNDFRGHINELGQSPESVDPHLGNNHVLVSHLCRLEETWQLAHKYLRDSQRLLDLLSLIEFISAIVSTEKSIHLRAAAQAGRSRNGAAGSSSPSALPRCTAANKGCSSESAAPSGLPASPHMPRGRRQQQEARVTSSSSTEGEGPESLEHRVVNCDVGAFLAIPRFVCLYYLLDPIHRLHLFRPFLPSLFGEESGEPVNLNDMGEEECSSGPSTPMAPAPPLAAQQANEPPSCSPDCAPVLSRGTGFARRGNDGSPDGTPRAGGCDAVSGPQGKPSEAESQHSPIGPRRAAAPAAAAAEQKETSLAQQAAAAQAAWGTKRQLGSRWGEGPRLSPSAALASLHDAQGEVESLSSTQASSLLSLSLSTSLQGMDSGGEAVRDPTSDAAADSSAASPDAAQDAQGLVPQESEGRANRLRVFPCHSDSDWYSAVPKPFCEAGKLWGPRCCRLVLSKVPRALRSMVWSWQKFQQWLQKAGLEGGPEPWLCVVARLSDTGAFEALMQLLVFHKVAGCRRYVEALFQAVEGVSMAMQRSCAAEWNEFLQVLITSVTRRLSGQAAPQGSRPAASASPEASGRREAALTEAGHCPSDLREVKLAILHL
ncbi:hypothetical protein Efla_001397 [Eimeria flavescens]